mmetsp:Transcript_90969/g.256965  ORF Transcript_90969/g.256965 Transcript_90969/m.256965 type:complete len:325 (-) Transcript_90969:1417-2391(-)
MKGCTARLKATTSEHAMLEARIWDLACSFIAQRRTTGPVASDVHRQRARHEGCNDAALLGWSKRRKEFDKADIDLTLGSTTSTSITSPQAPCPKVRTRRKDWIKLLTGYGAKNRRAREPAALARTKALTEGSSLNENDSTALTSGNRRIRCLFLQTPALTEVKLDEGRAGVGRSMLLCVGESKATSCSWRSWGTRPWAIIARRLIETTSFRITSRAPRCFMRKSNASNCMCRTALWMQVSPALSRMLTLAPTPTSNFKAWISPAAAANMRGVSCAASLVRAFGSSPSPPLPMLSSFFTVSMSPFSTALWRSSPRAFKKSVHPRP